jgi:hypothetical protein
MTVTPNADGTFLIQITGSLSDQTTSSPQEDFSASINVSQTVSSLSSLSFTVSAGDVNLSFTGSVANGDFHGSWSSSPASSDDNSDFSNGSFDLIQQQT